MATVKSATTFDITMLKKRSFMLQMLPGVDYRQFDGEGNGSLVELEADVLNNLIEFTYHLQASLLEAKLQSLPKLMIGYLSAYLGVFTLRSLGATKAEELRVDIEELIGTQAEYAYDVFSKYPMHVGSEKLGLENLQKLREATSSSIIDRTLELATLLEDSIAILASNFKLDSKTQLLSPLDPFFIRCIKTSVEKTAKSKNYWGVNSMLYIVNQMAVQIGWLIGHYSHLESKGRDTVLEYMLYVIPTIGKYLEPAATA